MSFQLPAPIVDLLLDKLGNDDEFRSAFIADTRTALATLGFAPAADATITSGLWDCLTVDHLASKEEIRRGHAVMRRDLSSFFVLFPFAIGVRHSDKAAA